LSCFLKKLCGTSSPVRALILVNTLIYVGIFIPVSVIYALSVGDPGSTILFILFPDRTGLLDFVNTYLPLMLSGAEVSQGAFWELITSLFMHANIIHLGFNMVALLYIGTACENYLGGRMVLITYFTGGLAGNLLSLALIPPTTYSLGASGAIFSLLGLLAVTEYRRTHQFLSSLGWAIIIFVISSVGLAGAVNIFAHFGGLAAGLLVGAALPKHKALHRY